MREPLQSVGADQVIGKPKPLHLERVVVTVRKFTEIAGVDKGRSVGQESSCSPSNCQRDGEQASVKVLGRQHNISSLRAQVGSGYCGATEWPAAGTGR